MSAAKTKIYLAQTADGQIKKFSNWPSCQNFVKGKNIPFGSGFSEQEAMEKLNNSKRYLESGKPNKGFSPKKGTKTPAGPPPKVGITSDAGTHGNPGPCEYQVTDLAGKKLDYKHLGVHTNNYAELAGILGMINVALKTDETIMWTDSQIAMTWIRSGKLGPTVKEPELILEMIHQIQDLLKANPDLKLKKWETKAWGQIPSDFGRK